MDESALIRKLLARSHLNVPERRQLPSGVARFSVIVAQASEVLATEGALPPEFKGANDFHGGVLEAAEGGYIVKECREIGILRYGPPKIRRYTDLAKAVRDWLKTEHGDAIDGIPIAWNE